MNPILFSAILLVIISTYYSYLAYQNNEMSDPKTQEQRDKELFDPDNLIINMGGKQVPFNTINKPHAVVIDPKNRPQHDPKNFPDLEPAAKEREAKLAAERANKQ